MALNVISNYAANVAHRNLTATDMAATSSLAKLSSGTRVVSAKDDAASLAIGSRLNAEVQALRQATVNAGQAISMLQIADGAMARVNDILVRMKTLSVQASSGQLGDTERGMLDTEFQALISEIDRIAADTEFNGQPLVSGAMATLTSLNGLASAGNLLEAADGFAKIEFGRNVGDAAVTFSYDQANGVLTATNHATGRSQGVNIDRGSAIGVNETQRIVLDELDMAVTLNAAFDKTSDIKPTGAFTLGAGAGAIETGSIRLLDVTSGSATTALAGLATSTGVFSGAAANAATLTLGGFAATGINLTTLGTKTVDLTNGTDTIQISFNVTTAFTNAALVPGTTLNVGGLGATVYGAANASAASASFSFRLGTGTTAGVDTVTYAIDAVTSSALGVSGSRINTQAFAELAISAVGNGLDLLNTARANIGASQNRLEFAAANLSTSIENSESARSSLLDLDIAAEMTNFTSKQILMQAGVSMLAQANQMPQNLLKLLQG